MVQGLRGFTKAGRQTDGFDDLTNATPVISSGEGFRAVGRDPENPEHRLLTTPTSLRDTFGIQVAGSQVALGVPDTNKISIPENTIGQFGDTQGLQRTPTASLSGPTAKGLNA